MLCLAPLVTTDNISASPIATVKAENVRDIIAFEVQNKPESNREGDFGRLGSDRYTPKRRPREPEVFVAHSSASRPSGGVHVTVAHAEATGRSAFLGISRVLC